MQIFTTKSRRRGAGHALLMTLVMTGVALVTLAGILSYSSSTARMNYRANEYNRAVGAAEAATEKVLAQISRDYVQGGEALVNLNLSTYAGTVPTTADSSYWNGWEFTDAMGNSGKTFVAPGAPSSYTVLNSAYSGLRGYATTYTLVSNAHETSAPQDVVGGVLQQIQLARVPIFQFGMYSSGDMEISCGQPFTITGRVHSNGQLYIEPDNLLTFQKDVTAVGSILFQRSPNDSRTPPVGSVVYMAHKDAHVAALTLPIGVSNSPTAVREIIEPPPPLESSSSLIGRQRYFNLTDMMLVVTNGGGTTGVLATSGKFNNFATLISTNEVKSFVSTSSSFWDAREGKTVQAIDIDIGALTTWSGVNTNLRPVLGGRDVSSIYVWDKRTLPGTSLGAVRLKNGKQLPSLGLTVATADPLYVWGHYNQYSDANLGTTNTSTTRPASIAADAITILSVNWSDLLSSGLVALRIAGSTTVNAAFLAGSVDTANGNYGGGMENFPRFLESWGLLNVCTYNGSMVKLFPSLYATNIWGSANVYDPPSRNWAYDINFDDATKLPPLTPGVLKVVRGLWATTAPNTTNAPAAN